MKGEQGEEFWSHSESEEHRATQAETSPENSTDVPTSSREGGGSFWRWQGQPIGKKSIDEDKKKEALAACSAPHATLVNCLRQGFTADCSEVQKAFWDCYTKHRGVRGNKIAAWFAPPSFSDAQKTEPVSEESKENEHS